MTPHITFQKASSKWKEEIFKWLQEPHAKEFWDTSEEHKNDIVLFMEHRVQPSSYFNGMFDYWLGFLNDDPYALIMTSEATPSDDLVESWKEHLGERGRTICLDFMIGNTKYLGKNLAGTTLKMFMEHFQKIDPSVETFFIDPETTNKRAIRAYENAGFVVATHFIRNNTPHLLFVKNSFSIQHASQVKEEVIFSFLKEHEEFSLFLLNNFILYGPTLTEHPNSATFYCVFDENALVGFFGLTRRGILLIDCTKKRAYPLILDTLKKEKIPLQGVMGEWNSCSSLWSFFKEMGTITQTTFEEKDILYSLDTTKKAYPENKHVRLLTYEDFLPWYEHNTLYFQELELPNRLSKEELQKEFFSKVERKIIWGFFLNGELVSVAALTAQVKYFGQVGGVYTTPAARKKGCATQLMQQLILDAKNIHGIEKLIIFTGEENRSARAVYESLGAEHHGYFALLFGCSNEA